MSDVSFLQSFFDLERRVERLETIEKPAVALPYNPAVALMPWAATLTGAGYFAQHKPSVIHRVRIVFYVTAPNDGANYWQFYLPELSSATTVYLRTTAASTAATWTLFDDVATNQPPSANRAIRFDVIKTGNPGTLYAIPALYALFQT
jgi:hypothetical protein